MDGRRDVAIDKAKTIVPVRGVGLVRKAEAVQSAIEPVPRTIAGKNAAGAIAAMSGGRQSNDKKAGIAGAEARHGAAPVFLVSKPPDFFLSDAFAVDRQPFAATAIDDLILRPALHYRPRYFSFRARNMRKKTSVLSMVPLNKFAPGPRAPIGISTAEWLPVPPAGGCSVVVGFRSRRFRGKS